jgi:hypothetical protein
MPATTYSANPEPESAAARLFLRLLERLGSGRLDLITPGGSLRTFDSGEPGPRALLRLADWALRVRGPGSREGPRRDGLPITDTIGLDIGDVLELRPGLSVRLASWRSRQ